MPVWIRITVDVVDAETTRAARIHERVHFDYAHWAKRPYSLFFAGDALRSGAGAIVRLSLSKLNLWGRARIHCAGNNTGRWSYWLQEVNEYDKQMQHHSNGRQSFRADRNALQGAYCLPPISKEEVLQTMRKSMFCVCPRGDSPSTSRVYFAISVGCIPIIVSDAWSHMAAPFPGFLNYSDFALSIAEGDVINDLESTLKNKMESLGVKVLSSGSQTKLRVPSTSSLAAAHLQTRLLAMHRTHRAALWQLRNNELLANLTLVSAWRRVHTEVT